jgi:hypothetical protein
MNKNLIILNPEEASKLASYLDYETNWKDLVTYERYLSIKVQQAVFESNEKGYEREKGF